MKIVSDGVVRNAPAASGDFALERVPLQSRRPMREVLWIELGIATGVSEFVVAATLGYSAPGRRRSVTRSADPGLTLWGEPAILSRLCSNLICSCLLRRRVPVPRGTAATRTRSAWA